MNLDVLYIYRRYPLLKGTVHKNNYSLSKTAVFRMEKYDIQYSKNFNIIQKNSYQLRGAKLLGTNVM